jgi:hypothetical protein
MKGYVPLEELRHWYKTWNVKIIPSNVRVMGGEPLLHPQIIDVIRDARLHWENSSVELITNGLLLPQMNDAFFECIRENRINVSVSHHFDDPYYNMLFDAGKKRLDENGIKPYIHKSYWYWVKSYRIDMVGQRFPYNSDPQKAWNICYVKNRCTTLIDNKLYRCPQLGCFSYAREKGFVSEAWDVVLDYQPLLPDCTEQEMHDFINGNVCKQCSICPEKFEYANMYEKNNPFELTTLNKVFDKEIHHE